MQCSGIHGPTEHRDLIVFLAAYLRTPLARYFLFHTSSNWGVSRQEIHVEEMLRLPMPLPDQQPVPNRCWEIVRYVARTVDEAARQADAPFADRPGIVQTADKAIEPLIEEYFDVLPEEKVLIEDTVRVIIESARPTRARLLVATLMPASKQQQDAYMDQVCAMLNKWGKTGPYRVRGQVLASELLGIGVAILEKVDRSQASQPMPETHKDLIQLLDRIRKAIRASTPPLTSSAA